MLCVEENETITRRRKLKTSKIYETQTTIETLEVIQKEISSVSLIEQNVEDEDVIEGDEAMPTTEEHYTSDDSASDGSDDEDDDDDDANIESKELSSPSSIPQKKSKGKDEFDVGAYMNEREMTPLQERMNAITIVPTPFFCIYFLTAGLWMNYHSVDLTLNDAAIYGIDSSQCTRSSAMPPLTAIAVAAAVVLHAPFSFLYHWEFAAKLPPGLARIDHWSRRLDHSFIHIGCALISYGTSGSRDYFLANFIFNADCVFRQFQKKVRPRQNKIRIGLSTAAYLLPILARGDFLIFAQLVFVSLGCLWLFAAYPFGGWSHSLFHIAYAFAPPLLLITACRTSAGHDQIRLAAHCAAHP